MKRSIPVLLMPVCLFLAACAPPGGSGQLSFRVQRPQTFGLKVIPSTATSLRLTVTTSGSSQAELSQDLPLTAQTVSHTLILSPGRKQLEVIAVDAAGETLARGSQAVEINVGQTTRAELELATVAPRPQTPGTGSTPDSQPTPGPGGSGQTPDSNPTAAPGSEIPPQPEDSPAPQTTSSPAPEPTASPVPVSTGGGGTSGGGSSAQIVLSGLIADPTALPGAGYVSELKPVFNPTATGIPVSWTCLDAASQSCATPAQDTSGRYFWTGPASGTSPFTVTAIYDAGSGNLQQQSVSISVERGTSGPLQTGPGTIDGGESGGAP